MQDNYAYIITYYFFHTIQNLWSAMKKYVVMSLQGHRSTLTTREHINIYVYIYIYIYTVLSLKDSHYKAMAVSRTSYL